MYQYIRPLLFCLPPRWAHAGAIRAAQYIQSEHTGSRFIREHVKERYEFSHPSLRTYLAGIQLDNPIGLAAGFDKNGRMIDTFHDLGFGFTEIGSVTAELVRSTSEYFRLPQDRALINRARLRNEGAFFVKENSLLRTLGYPIGLNVAATPGKTEQNAMDDMMYTIHLFDHHYRYITLNVSCPNTTDGKTFEEPAVLDDLLAEVQKMRLNVPVFVKVSPDVENDQLERIVEKGGKYHVGYIISNTTKEWISDEQQKRLGLKTSARKLGRIGKDGGGLSGLPLQQLAEEKLKFVYRLTQGNVPLIGVGGIIDAESAYRRIKAGATAIQILTMLIYQGPGAAKMLKEGIVELMQRDGVHSINEIVGIDAR
ncbi:quinone-dependent dihydroorotate dehydrogenase [Candidatus Woesearchaeota archaeon]|nr:quinone-dependent dihydroorotate dehydrogenase [Candidatus Woesearchaeota archaeon]